MLLGHISYSTVLVPLDDDDDHDHGQIDGDDFVTGLPTSMGVMVPPGRLYLCLRNHWWKNWKILIKLN